jgi:HEAT repeat protein
LGAESNASSRERPRPAPSESHKKSGVPVLLIAGGIFLAFLALGAIGGGVWYFKYRDSKPVAKVDDPPPAVEPKSDPKPTKRLKITPAPKLEGNDIYKLLLPATVMIRTNNALGSGVLICRDPNLIVTNHHVVSELATVRVFFPEFTEAGQVIRERSFYDENDAKLAIRGRVLERDKTRDLAVVEVDRVPENSQPVPLAKKSADELDRVFGIGGSSADLNSLWQANEGSVRQVLPPTEGFGAMYCRLMISQQPTYHGDSGGPIVSNNLELVAIVQGGLPVKADVIRDRNGKQVILVEGREGMALNVDVEEIREMVEKTYKTHYMGTFPEIPPLHEPGITQPPEGENYTAEDYVQILREGNPTEARVAVDRLISLGGQSVPPLKDMLDDPKAAGRWPQALTALEKIGPPASDAMDVAAKRLTSDNPAVRIGAVKYLAAMGYPGRRHIPAMIRAADSNNPSVKQACEKSIIKLGPFGKSDQTLILGEAEDKDPNLRGLRARLLVEMDLPQAEKVRLMDPFFKDKHPIVRADAARAVCKPDKFPRADVYRHVVPFLGDTDYSVRSAARDSLNNIGRVEVADLESLRPFFANESAEVHYYLLQRVRPLGERASPIVPELSKSLNFPNDEVKFEAIQTALAINRDLKLLTKDFIALSHHDKPSFRWSAVQCLKQIGKDEPGVLTAMFERLSDGAEVTAQPRSLEQLAADSFKDMKDKVRLISDLPPVNPNAPPVWQFTTALLNQMRPFKIDANVKEIKEFLGPMDKRSMYAQYYAATCIAESGIAARVALNDLSKTLSNREKVTDHEIRSKLCEGIGNCGPDAAPAAKLLGEFATMQIVEDKARSPGDQQVTKNQMVRSAALRALGKLGPGCKDALPELIKLTDPFFHESIHEEVIKTLGNLGPYAVDAVPNLMDLFLKNRPQQRDLLVDTMKKIGPGSLPPIIDFLPKFEKQWREKAGPYKDQILKAKGCVECIIVLGPGAVKSEQRAKVIDDLKSLRAQANIKGDTELLRRLGVALALFEGGKK